MFNWICFFFSSRRRHTRYWRDWSSDVCSSDLIEEDKGVGEIVASGFDEGDVRRVMKLVDAAEYKRRQAPIGIKVTSRAFGRDRRMPMTNRYSERGPGETDAR